MASYRLEIIPSAIKELEALPKRDRERLLVKLVGLAEDQRPAGSTKLKGQEHIYRIRQGNYRALYTILEKDRIVRVERVSHRREAYR